MSILILYHGTSERIVQPTYGLGNDRHDYGRGFYLTESCDLAKEWAVCRPNETNGWMHKYELETDGLTAVDYSEFNRKYNQHDISARAKMRELVDSEANRVTKVFRTLF